MPPVSEQPPAPPAPSRDAARSRRKHLVPARSIRARQMTKRDIEIGRALYPEDTSEGRPIDRGDCAGGERPCPRVSCRHHLYLDVTRTGSIKINFPDLDVDEIPATCSLDVADGGGETLERVGDLLNITREAVRLIERRALAKVIAAGGPFAKEGDRED